MKSTTKNFCVFFSTIFVLYFFAGCVSKSPSRVIEPTVQKEELSEIQLNFLFVSYDREIISPESDTDAYFKVFIDKKGRGETNIALRSQKKEFETDLSEDRHLLRVEKWIYNEKEKLWTKAPEKQQPDYLYFDIQKEKKIVVTLEYTKDGAAHKFLISYESENP